ncbi:MAG: AAA family ATPase [Candidatus Helarchaeota archaeon]
MFCQISEKLRDIWYNPDKYTIIENGSQKKVYDNLYNAIIRGLNERRCILFLYGEFGVGKTFLARRLMKSLENEQNLTAKIKYVDVNELIFQNMNIYEDNYNKTDLLEKIIFNFLDENEENTQIIIFDSLECLPSNFDFINLGFNYASNGRVLLWILPNIDKFIKLIDEIKENKKFFLEFPTIVELKHFKSYFYSGEINFLGIRTYHDVLKRIEEMINEN